MQVSVRAFLGFNFQILNLLLLVLYSSIISAQAPKLVKDINILKDFDKSSLCSQPVVKFGLAYFCGDPDLLWVSDGSSEGTHPVRTQNGQTIGYQNSYGQNGYVFEHTLVDNNFYFNAEFEHSGNNILWVINSDTPDMARPVTDSNGGHIGNAYFLSNGGDELFFFARGYLWSKKNRSPATKVWRITYDSIKSAVAANGVLYFLNNSGAGTAFNYHLWKSDGTVSGTQIIKTIPGYESTENLNLTNVNGTIYFGLQKNPYHYDLWKSDGTLSGTILVKQRVTDFFSHRVKGFFAFNDNLYFFTEERNNSSILWKSDGTTAGTQQVKRFDNQYPTNLTIYDNKLAFLMAGELWMSDGTTTGTVKPLPNLKIGDLTVHDHILYVSADDQSGIGRELWKSDGTEAGTSLVRDIAWQAKSSLPHFMTAIDNGVLFQATKNERQAGKEIWISDGSRKGTKPVKDLATYTASARPSLLTQVGEDVYFVVNKTRTEKDSAANQKWQIWKSDGSNQGTVLAADIVPNKTGKREKFGGEYGELVEFENQLYFSGNDSSGWTLWRTDGTPTNTFKFDQLFPDGANGYLKSLTVVNNQLLFFRMDGYHTSLWSLSSGETTAVLVKSDLVNPYSVITSLDKLFFVNNLNELWSSNGQAYGTHLVTQYIRPGFRTFIHRVEPFTPEQITFMVSYREDNQQNQVERGLALWASDGSANGTYELIRFPDITSGVVNLVPRFVNDGLIYTSTIEGLWVSDGTISGTQLLSIYPMNAYVEVGGTVYLNNPTLKQLWKTDGTTLGTVPASNEVIDDFVNAHIGAYPALTNIGDQLYLNLDRGLSKFDESTSSIVLVNPVSLILGTEQLYRSSMPANELFVGTDSSLHQSSTKFHQFWQTDGTSAGTKVISDFFGFRYFDIKEQLLVNNKLFLSMKVRPFGTELWVIDTVAEGTSALGDKIWLDANQNGLQEDGELGLAGIAVNLEDCHGNVLNTTVSDDRGFYQFANLAPGRYRLRFIKPRGYSFSPKFVGSDIKRDSNADPNTGLDNCKTITENQKRLAVDAGLYADGIGSVGQIGDRVWLDIDADGIQEQTESGLAGVTVQLEDCKNNILNVTTTDNNGGFLFDQLSPANYRLRFILPTGYQFSPKNTAGDFQIDSNPNPRTGLDACRSLADGQRRYALDAGMYQ